MKTNSIAFLVLFFFSMQSKAQFFENLGNKAIEAATRTVERKVEEKAEKTTSDAADKVLNSKKKTSRGEESSQETKQESKSKNSKSDSRSSEIKSAKDFVSGNKTLVFEDFTQDAIGDFPVNWMTSSSGEVVTISGTSQRWLKLEKNGTFTINDIKLLPENFTLEFEVFVNKGEFSYYSTYLGFGFIESKKKNDYAKWNDFANENEGVLLKIHPTNADNSKADILGMSAFDIFSGGEKIIKNEMNTPAFNLSNNNRVKVQIWRQKNRLRMYLGDKKVWDLPNAFQQVKYNKFILYVNDYQEDNDKYYVTNLRLAEATADTRHKLLETGTFTTNDILFDSGKAVIKPSSATVIDEIGTVLKNNPKIKVSITGHTDNDGDAKKNQELSELRAMAVKNELIRKFNLNQEYIQVIGKGASTPVAENKTEAGKKQNRRVEFNVIK